MKHLRKALVLAAGFGQRLHPLTEKCPKPLLPFMGVPILEIILRRLAQAHFSHVAINTHYLSHRIETYIDAHPPKDLAVHLSFEPQILGTAGVFRPLSVWREEEDILVHNADVITDFPLEACMSSIEKSTWATMGLLAEANPTEKNQIWIKGGNVEAIGQTAPIGEMPIRSRQPGHDERDAAYTSHGFACIHTLSGKFLREIEDSTNASIIPYYQKALSEDKKIHAAIPPLLFWADVGTPQAYWHAHQHFFHLLETMPTHPWVQFIKETFTAFGFFLLYEEERKGCFFHGYNVVHESVELRAGCIIGPRSVLAEDCTLCEGCFVERTILLPTVQVAPHSQLSRSIVAREATFSFCI